MVHKRYVWKNGKKFGPYYYESYREGDKIKKRYIGTESESRSDFNFYLGIGVILVVLLAFFFIWRGVLTGKVVAELDDSFSSYNYTLGENLKGNLKASLMPGELIPKDAKVIVEIGNETREMFLYELVTSQTANGNYYLEGNDLSGNGEGFGIIGRRTVYPLVNFELEISNGNNNGNEEGNNSENSSDLVKVAAETNTSNDSSQSLFFQPVSNDSISNDNDKKDEKALEKASAPSSEGSLKGSLIDNGNLQATKDQEEIIAEDKGKSLSSEAISVKSGEDMPDSKAKPEESTALVEATGPITGAAVSEDKKNIIHGNVKQGEDFVYELGKGKDAQIIPGSVEVNGSAIGDDKIALTISDGTVSVTTNYSIIQDGFGPDYSGAGGNLSLAINLTKIEIPVSDQNVKIDIVFDNASLFSFSYALNLEMNENSSQNNNSNNVSMPQNTTNITLPQNITNATLLNQTNLTFVNETNITLLNITSNFTGNLSLDKDILVLKIMGNQSLDVNLSDYFTGAESYTFIGKNINWSISGGVLSLRADEDFRGYTNARITAYRAMENVSSRDFTILVSSGNLTISTLRHKISLGEPVRWIKNITNDVIENITLDLPSEASNISVVKIDKESVQAVFSSGSISGNVVYSGQKKESVFDWLSGFFRKLFNSNLNANVVFDDSSNFSEPENLSDIEVKLQDNSAKYVLEYYTAPPVAWETEYNSGKHIEISAPESLNYTDVIAFTELKNDLGIKSKKGIKVYWHELSSASNNTNETKTVNNVLNITEIESTDKLLNPSGEGIESVTTSDGTVISVNVSYESLNNNTVSEGENASEILDNDTLANAESDWGYVLREIPFEAEDKDNDSNIDYISWVVPHFSNQTFEIILVSKAEHLDENRSLVENVYDFVKSLDSNWTSIPEGHYLRVQFEQNLTSSKDITIYARPINSSNASIEVYEKDQNRSIAMFEQIANESYYKIYLTNLEESQNIFDLLIKNGSVDFDYVVDPSPYNVTICNSTTGCLYVRNSSGRNVAIFDKFGNLDLKGNLTQSSVGTPNGKDFIIQTGYGVEAWVDGNTGNMRINGTLTKNSASCAPPTDSFVIKNTSGDCVSFIDWRGNLILRGDLVENATIS